MNTAMGSSNLRSRRQRSAVSSADASKNSEESSTQEVKPMKAPNSYHGVGVGAARASSYNTSSRTRKPGSFHGVDGAAHRRCPVHQEVPLSREDEVCPKCSIELMKIAAKTLERRAAELELERQEKEAEAMAKSQMRRERKLTSLMLKEKSSAEMGWARQNEPKALLRWSTSFEYASGRRSSDGVERGHPKYQELSADRCRGVKSSANKGGVGTRVPLPPKPQFSLGDVARPLDMEELSSRSDSLIRIARLKVGDGAWVKRTDSVFTYATLKARENGPDAMLIFTVNERGSTKKFPVTHWAKYVRLVATKLEKDLDWEEDEKEIDEMFGDEDSLVSLEPTNGPARAFSSRNSSSSSSNEAVGRDILRLKDQKDPPLLGVAKERGDRGNEGGKILQGEEVSMYTLGLQNESCLARRQHGLASLGKQKPSRFPKPPRDEVQTLDPKVQTSFRSSISSIVELEEVEANDGKSCAGEEPPGACKIEQIKKILGRSSSLPCSHGWQKEQCEMPEVEQKRDHRSVSWSEKIDLIKEELKTDVSERPPLKKLIDGSFVEKKKLTELDMGKTISKHKYHGQESFYSALKSIHRRSSVMMPPTTGVAVNLN